MQVTGSCALQESDNERWCGSFSAEYVEEICAKTGNFKKFAVFVRMLATAFARNSQSVFVDLLTYADLELLKSRKPNGSTANSDAGKQLRKSNKASEGGTPLHDLNH